MFKEDYLKSHLKDILSEESYKDVRDEIATFPDTKKYYRLDWNKPSFLMQGDWIQGAFHLLQPYAENGLFLNIVTKLANWIKPYWKKFAIDKPVFGFILSNTCDIDASNSRQFNEPNIVFSPIIPLSKYIHSLRSGGISEEKINSHIDSIRKQEITSIFYLPDSQVIDESIVFFDRISNTSNIKVIDESIQEQRKFSLNQVWYYILLMKIWIHFSRPWEHLDRNSLNIA